MQRSSEADLVDAMLVASRALVAVAARSLADAPGDVTLTQFRTLVVLTTRGPQTPGALTEELATAPSSVTRLCDRLARKGLVERHASPTDGRQVEIHITPKGRDLVDRVTSARRLEIERLVHVVPAEHRALLTQALLELGRAAGEAPEQSWTAGWGR